MCALVQVNAGQSFSDFSGEAESLEALLKPVLFMVWEVQVQLEKCISNKLPGNADAGGLGTGLGGTGDGKQV